MAERFLMILEGGPFPKEYRAPTDLAWPLPDLIFAEGHIKGVYRKVFESKGPPKIEEGVIKLRGAKYEWDDEAMALELME